MTFEEALAIVTTALAPQSLSDLQTNVFRGAWNKDSYQKISLKLNHEYSYIKDVGAELWQLLTQRLGIQVTKLNLQTVLTQYAQQGQIHSPVGLQQRSRVDWGEAPDVSHFCGRRAQLAVLEQWIVQDRCRLVAIAGTGGIGKTMLAAQLTQQLVDSDQFEVVVWRSLQQAQPLVDFLTELLQALCTRDFVETTPDQSDSSRLNAMMRQLLEQLRRQRCLLILDNAEAVLCSELIGTYRPGYEDYGWLFQQLGEGRHQSSVLLTSRETPTEIAIQAGPAAAVRLLRLDQLSIEEGKAILAVKGLPVQTEQGQVQKLIERYQGNPLALKLAATAIQNLYGSNIAAFLAEETQLFKDIHDSLAHQFDRLSLLEQQVMHWLTLHREAAIAAQLQVNLLSSAAQVELRNTLTESSVLACWGNVSNTQQFAMMEYINKQLNEQVCQKVN
ncbi:AAA family ATPase [Leptolyngbya sp. FACHB-671]|uniref:NB-ARC domain-containing protein n=1 Tax=Leptolyngbya sp. FACHB-671 TaxID=2692812 RepID=UPI00168931D4|nr:NB-ARC domain-containing protein [Leptolyngbya sp. FACHB-671]MBD2067653.1 AAA family ATPase [Leptolyngbya sp. FACHB-671]